MPTGETARHWPQDKLTALQRGQRLVAEVPASQAGRRAFVAVTSGGQVGAFRLELWEYDADQVEGWDYDVGAVLVRSAAVASHAELTSVVLNWHLRPDEFDYPWNTDDPQ
ncbi:hypothetical protein KDK95_04000 [Actinospica sp. MGRD01-02]|uniref:Uncharacterized protein n=1 Tax=Actinospica acidithermotolerans TaxID=2828514 RepID=A0A941E5E6_9ACTN|nr:hypothetical protein [Actinospica acidithermotolerans]MBR7825456.1 hypothetical protein [Actinospica acidithermotolerans]